MAIIGFDPIAIVRLSIRTLFGIANTFEPRIRVNVSALPVPTEVDTITISSALTRFSLLYWRYWMTAKPWQSKDVSIDGVFSFV